MVSRNKDGDATGTKARENIGYISQMLGELRSVASEEGADMLCYLLEMAYVEAGDILIGRRQLSIVPKSRVGIERNEPTRMAVKPAGKVQF